MSKWAWIVMKLWSNTLSSCGSSVTITTTTIRKFWLFCIKVTGFVGFQLLKPTDTYFLAKRVTQLSKRTSTLPQIPDLFAWAMYFEGRDRNGRRSAWFTNEGQEVDPNPWSITCIFKWCLNLDHVFFPTFFPAIWSIIIWSGLSTKWLTSTVQFSDWSQLWALAVASGQVGKFGAQAQSRLESWVWFLWPTGRHFYFHMLRLRCIYRVYL